MSASQSKMSLVSAGENLDLLSEKQREFWDFYYEDKDECLPIRKSEIDPVKLQRFLPNLWMADLFINECGEMEDAEFRLVGTELVKYFGELTHKRVVSDTSEGSYRQMLPGSYERFIKSIEFLLKNKEPLIIIAEYLSRKKDHVTTRGLILPVKYKSDNINMIIGFHEVSFRID